MDDGEEEESIQQKDKCLPSFWFICEARTKKKLINNVHLFGRFKFSKNP
jgi:hypothetical protein